MKGSALDHLVLLINAMTREEKRYFKLYLKGLGKVSGHQSRLFDFLSKHNYSNNKTLKEQLKKKFPHQNRSALQINTYQNILKSLQLFHTNTSAEMRLLDLLKTIRLLSQKNLHSLALLEVQKAKQLALDYEQTSLLPKILLWEILIQGSAYGFNDVSKEALNAQYQLIEEKLDELENIYLYTKAWTDFYLYMRHEFSNETSEANNTNPACIQDLPIPTSIHSTVLESRIKALKSYLENSYEGSSKAIKPALKAFEQSPKLIEEYFTDYISCLYRMVGQKIASKQWKEALHYLEIYEQTPRQRWSATIHAGYCELLFHYHFRSGKLEGSATAVQLAKSLLEDNSHQLKHSTTSLLKIAIAVQAFYQQDYDTCIDYLNQLENLNYEDINATNTIRILLMLAYYEKQEHVLLPYVIRSNYRFFKKDEPRRALGRTVTKTMSKLSKTIVPEKIKKIFLELKTTLAEEHHAFYDGTLQFFDLRAWIFSKLEGISIQQALLAFRDKSIITKD